VNILAATRNAVVIAALATLSHPEKALASTCEDAGSCSICYEYFPEYSCYIWAYYCSDGQGGSGNNCPF
jgi:hypothetical protein